MNVQGFTPVINGTVTAAATSASANYVMTVGTNLQEVMVQNAGPNVAFFRYGLTAQTATANDFPLLPNAVYLLTVGPSNNFAVISPAGTATVYITAGEGS